MSVVQSTRADWRSVADQLAGALKEAMLRNPGLNAAGWARARAALGQYAQAAGADPESATAADPQEPVTP